eukprot:ctg_341.g104
MSRERIQMSHRFVPARCGGARCCCFSESAGGAATTPVCCAPWIHLCAPCHRSHVRCGEAGDGAAGSALPVHQPDHDVLAAAVGVRHVPHRLGGALGGATAGRHVPGAEVRVEVSTRAEELAVGGVRVVGVEVRTHGLQEQRGGSGIGSLEHVLLHVHLLRIVAILHIGVQRDVAAVHIHEHKPGRVGRFARVVCLVAGPRIGDARRAGGRAGLHHQTAELAAGECRLFGHARHQHVDAHVATQGVQRAHMCRGLGAHRRRGRREGIPCPPAPRQHLVPVTQPESNLLDADHHALRPRRPVQLAARNVHVERHSPQQRLDLVTAHVASTQDVLDLARCQQLAESLRKFTTPMRYVKVAYGQHQHHDLSAARRSGERLACGGDGSSNAAPVPDSLAFRLRHGPPSDRLLLPMSAHTGKPQRVRAALARPGWTA